MPSLRKTGYLRQFITNFFFLDAGDVYMNAVEELTFTTVATSDSTLFPSSNINSRQCGKEGKCTISSLLLSNVETALN